MANSIITEMKNGNKKAIIDGLSHSGAIYRMNAIGYATLFKLKDTEVITQLKILIDDNKRLDGYSVGSFAKAALALLGVEAYTENNAEVKELINSKFSFMN